MSDIVYLDVCCFKRPFDDATQERVRWEAEAVAAILDAATRGGVRLVRSPAHDAENARNPREERRLATRLWLEAAVLAFAEQSSARWFATTDDRLLKRARDQRDHIHVQVLGPDEIPLPVPGGAA